MCGWMVWWVGGRAGGWAGGRAGGRVGVVGHVCLWIYVGMCGVCEWV